MQYVYFTKMLRGQDIEGMAAFIKQATLDGADLAVRPGFPVHPGNVTKRLPETKRIFADQGLAIPMVTAPTNMTDASESEAQRIFEACGENGVSAIKIGYFRYSGRFEADLTSARRVIDGFAKLAEKTGVRACCHTHSGSYIGSNCAGLRLLLEDADPHHVGAFVDTGHQSVGGSPMRMALDQVAPWLSLLAIKDVAWEQTDKGWRRHVVPAGEGFVDWKQFALAVRERRFDGTISLHAEYHIDELPKRLAAAQAEVKMLRGLLKGGK